MSWMETSTMEQRFEFVLEYESGDFSMAGLCRRHGISRVCGYKWVSRYREEGLAGLEDRSCRPHHCPHVVDETTSDAILSLRRRHPHWGPRKLLVKLEETCPARSWPSSSTIGELLSRNGLAVPRRRRPRATPSAQPFSHAVCSNDEWAVDFKGWFLTGDGIRCDPLTLQDSTSRFLLRCQSVAHLGYEDARGVLEAAFREHGLPGAMRSDNGEPFASVGIGGLSRLSIWWTRLGISLARIRPGNPQENGRLERFHRTLKQETATPPAATLRSQQARFDRFRREYNEERPHEALGQRTPASVYVCSPRPYPARIPELTYHDDMEVRTVQERGQFRFRGDRIFLGCALEGEHVGLFAIDERYWLVYYSDILLGVADAKQHRILRPKQAQKRVSGYTEAIHYLTSAAAPSPGGGQEEGEEPCRPSQDTSENDCKV